MVIAQPKKRLPPAVAGQLDGLVGEGGSSKGANPLGGLTDKLSGFLGKSKTFRCTQVGILEGWFWSPNIFFAYI